MRYYLAIDIGASSGRHILCRKEGEKMVTEEIYRFSNQPKAVVTKRGKELFWDVERLFLEIVTGMKKAKELGKIPVSVGVDTWGVDYALLDEHDALVRPVYSYRDKRTDKAVSLVHEKLPFATLYRKTGIGFNCFNTVYQLYDDKKEGILEKAKSFLMLPDYFHFRLTGVKKQEYTNATTTGMVNAQTGSWDQEILSGLGYPSALFYSLCQPSELVGTLSEKIKEEVGYDCRVCLPATHDTASAVVAAPIERGAPYISSGTWSLLGVERPFAHTDRIAQESGYSNEGGVEKTFRLQKNIMGLWMIQNVKREAGETVGFAELAELAKNNPVSETVEVNDERFFSPENMTEEISAAVGRKLSLGETAFVVFDSLARSYGESLGDLERLKGERYKTLNIIGGGSKNEFLNELTKRHTGKKIVTGPTEGTAIGNLIMQMIGDGALSSVAEGRTLVKNSFEIKEI